MSQTEIQAEFADALHRAGLRPKGAPIMDGRKHRVPVEGDRRGRLSGTYIGHLDAHPAGYIHNFKTGEEIRWRASRPNKETTPGERAAVREVLAAQQAARDAQRRHQEAVVSHAVSAVWNRAKPVQTHPYLTRKGVEAHGLRQNRHGELLVPMRDIDGRLWSVQTITPDGGKLFRREGRKQGTHALLGELQPGAPVVIAEGFATAATLRETTSLATVVAFDSGNLMEVAQAYRERDPQRPIIFAADNDHHLPRREPPLPNVGLEKAAEAAEAVRGIVLVPSFAPTDKGTDWNDYAAQHGKVSVRAQVQAALAPHAIKLPEQSAARRVTTQADRDAAWKRQTAFPNGKPKSTDQALTEAAKAARAVRPRRPRL